MYILKALNDISPKNNHLLNLLRLQTIKDMLAKMTASVTTNMQWYHLLLVGKSWQNVHFGVIEPFNLTETTKYEVYKPKVAHGIEEQVKMVGIKSTSSNPLVLQVQIIWKQALQQKCH